jgi:hypothetical protein
LIYKGKFEKINQKWELLGVKADLGVSTHGLILEGVYKIELDTKTEYGGFRGHLPHSKTGILKKIVGVLFEKIDFKDIHYWLYSWILHQFLYKGLNF